MRQNFCLLFLFSSCVLFGQSSNQPAVFNFDSLITAQKMAVLGKSFPAFVANSEGRKVSNEILKGKVVLINFWFETCHGCMTEMKALNELHDKLKNSKDFLFISFTRDNDQAIKRVKDKYGIRFKVLSTTSSECSRLMMVQSGYPTTMILDKNGVIRYAHGTYDALSQMTPDEIIGTVIPSEIKSLL